MTDYETRCTNVPPVLAIEDGRLVIKLIDGPLTLIAEVGDGRYFFSQVVAKLVDPALAAQVRDAKVLWSYPMCAGGTTPLEPGQWRYVPYTHSDGTMTICAPFASPND